MELIQSETDKKFILGMKSNRLIAFSKKNSQKGQYHNSALLHLKEREKKIVWLKHVSFPVALIKKFFINEDGTSGALYLVSND